MFKRRPRQGDTVIGEFGNSRIFTDTIIPEGAIKCKIGSAYADDLAVLRWDNLDVTIIDLCNLRWLKEHQVWVPKQRFTLKERIRNWYNEQRETR